MADLIDIGDAPDAAVSALYALSGEAAVYGGGGLRSQLVPNSGENELLESIQHRAIVPIFLARNDSGTIERWPTNDSVGIANQPVAGGTVAPTGLISPDQYDTHYNWSGGNNQEPSPSVLAPRSTGSIWSSLLGGLFSGGS